LRIHSRNERIGSSIPRCRIRTILAALAPFPDGKNNDQSEAAVVATDCAGPI
jgi:hypothetical protein